MAKAKRKAPAKVPAAARPLDALSCEQAQQLRQRASGERNTITALELRVAALEKLVSALIAAR
jgi:hypothetical protein